MVVAKQPLITDVLLWNRRSTVCYARRIQTSNYW